MQQRRVFGLFFVFIFLFQVHLSAAPKYALGLFHFNLQYVAGDYRIESRIIRESLYPALKFFEQNPQYKSDIEIQGYAIESLAEEHPEVLALLKKLVDRGQIELVVAHYSDQFFIAYPALDLQRSVQISDGILKKHHIKRSRVFFGQEIQWSPGLAYALNGLYDVLVTSGDPHGYYRDETQPLVRVNYDGKSMLALIGGGKKNLGFLEWTWAFFDDGEVFNSLDYNSDFYRVPEQEKKNIDRYRQLEKDGYQFVTISEFVNILKNHTEYRVPDYPFVPEGTWNMQVGGPFLWMGKQRSGVEKDGPTRATCYQTRGLVLLAERLVDYLEKLGIDVTALRQKVEKAWRHVLLAEVSDSSGWTPWLVEVQYTDNEVANARMVLRQIFSEVKKYLPTPDKPYLVQTRTGEVRTIKGVHSEDYPPATLTLLRSVRAKKYSVQYQQINDGLYRLDIRARRPQDGAVEITFYTADDGLKYSAGCGEEAIVDLPKDLKHDPILSLSNGFLYLGNGYSIIKDCSVEHLAATWRRDRRYVVFREELNEKMPGMKMRFYVVKGTPQQGHALANRLNTWPSYVVQVKEGRLVPKKVLPGMVVQE